MVEKKNLTVRVPIDTYGEFEDYRERRGGISKADAGRRLLEQGLKTADGGVDTASSASNILEGIGEGLGLTWLVLLPVYLLTSAIPVAVVGTLAVLTIVFNLEAIIYKRTGTGFAGIVSRKIKGGDDV